MRPVRLSILRDALAPSRVDAPRARADYISRFVADNRYRGGRFPSEQALDDTFSTAYFIAKVGLSEAPTDGRCEIIELSRRQIESNLVGASFRREEMRLSEAIAALLSQSIHIENELTNLRMGEDRLSFLTIRFP